MTDWKDPPRTWAQTARYFGPGLVLTASVVGSGEVIATPSLSARVGYALLWLILLSCVVKLPLQIIIGRIAIQTGRTTLQIMDDLPGPRLGAGRGASWFVWAFVAMLVIVNLQQGAMIAGCAEVLSLTFPAVDARIFGGLIAVVTILLLRGGNYGALERASTVLVLVFTAATIICIGFLQGTQYRTSPAELVTGLVPHLSADSVALALGVFAITGIGTSEIVQYPYWCLAKGYGRNTGGFDGTPAWYARARGWIRTMHADALLSMVIYTVITIAFYVLGASVLHRLGLAPEGMTMIDTLSRMYTQTVGAWAFFVFLAGAFAALYSTLIVSISGNTDLFLDSLSLMGVRRLADPDTRARWRRGFVTGLPLLQLALYLVLKTPVWMVTLGALGQAAMLPLVAGSILYVRHTRLDRGLAPSRVLDGMLWLGCLLIGAVALYGIVVTVRG